MSTFRRLLTYLKPYKKLVFIGLFCLAGTIVLELLPPLVWKYIVDTVLVQGRWSALVPVTIGLLVIQSADTLLSIARLRITESVGQRFVCDLRNQLYDKLLHQSIKYFNEVRTGDLVSRISADVDLVQDVTIKGVGSVLANILRLVGVGIIFCSLNFKLGVATLIPTLILAILLKKFNKGIKARYRKMRDRFGGLNARIQDNLSGIAVVKSFAHEDRESLEFKGLIQEYLLETLHAVRARTTFFPFVKWVASLGSIITIVYGAYMILVGQFTVGGLIAYRGYGRYFYGPIDDLTQINDDVQRAVAAGNRIFEILDAPNAVQDAPNARLLSDVKGEIAFEHVSFHYVSAEHTVLDDVSFKIRPGQKVAFVGESGAGKSTIFALLLRFWDPVKGRILLDDVPLTDIAQQSFRRHMAAVHQDSFLFTTSVLENIRYARPDATDAEVQAAARAANAHTFVSKLPDGYNTLVGERGNKLSGGQRQRIAIARAFLSDPQILLLDEATSAVEPESEMVVQDAINRLMQGRTTIVAAHRLSTVRDADVIYVLNDTHIAEQGTHTELIGHGGIYASMMDPSLRAAAGAPVIEEIPVLDGYVQDSPLASDQEIQGYHQGSIAVKMGSSLSTLVRARRTLIAPVLLILFSSIFLARPLFSAIDAYFHHQRKATVLVSNPGVVVIPNPQIYSQVFAVSDAYGHYDNLVHLLKTAGILSTNLKWSAGNSLLIVVGNSIDKGPQSLEVLALWKDMQQQAAKSKGRVIVLMGSHEGDLLAHIADPYDYPDVNKFSAITENLKSHHMTMSDLSNPTNPITQQIEQMPVAARVGTWLFCSSGWPPDMKWDTFVAAAQSTLRQGDYSNDFLIGRQSILEKEKGSDGLQKWWLEPGEISALEHRLDAYGIYGDVFGHKTKVFNLVGNIGPYTPVGSKTPDYHLIKINGGLASGSSDDEDEDNISAQPFPGHVLLFKRPGDLVYTKKPEGVWNVSWDGQRNKRSTVPI